jgi:acyl carrier protein
MRDRIKEAMARAFNLPVEQIPNDAAAGSFTPWDSLGHLQLMLELETTFGTSFTTEEMLAIDTLDKIEAHLSAAGLSP